MNSNEIKAEFDSAMEIAKDQPSIAAQKLHAILTGTYPNDTESLKVKESAVDALVKLLMEQGESTKLRSLLDDLRPWFAVIPKAKTAKQVRLIIDSIGKIPGTSQILLEVCKEQAAWATSEKRTFLRQRIDLRLATLYLDVKEYTEALNIISKLLSEVKRLDDKMMLVEIHLLESKAHSAVRNLPKSRAALTAARSAANAVYIPPSLQADIDIQSGTLHAEEKDFKTAYSYFFEAFEQLSALDDKRAVTILKYMLLCKIMSGDVSDVASIIASKGGLKYAGSDVDALRAISKAYESRSLEDFQRALTEYETELVGDQVVHSHLTALYDMLLEQNLLRLIEPFSRVEVLHIASLINLPSDQVETKLSQMILDKKIAGTLDQGVGVLEVFDEIANDQIYPTAVETMGNIDQVVESLFARARKIAAV